MEQGEEIKKVNKQFKIKKMKRIKNFHLIVATMLIFLCYSLHAKKNLICLMRISQGQNLKKLPLPEVTQLL
jgi:hypothetical protein